MGAGRLKGNKRKKRRKGSKKEENILFAGIEPRGFGMTGSYVTDTGHLLNEFMNRTPSQNGKGEIHILCRQHTLYI